MSKDIKNENKDLDEFEFDFEEDSKEEELDDFDFDEDSESDSKSDSDNDFDFDAGDSDEESSSEKEDDFEFDDDDNEDSDIDDDFDFDSNDSDEESSSNKEDDFDFDDDDNEDSDIDDDFDFDANDSDETPEESKEDESKEEDFDFGDDKENEEDFDFDDNDLEEESKEEDFDFDVDDDDDSTINNDEEELKKEQEKEEKQEQEKLKEDAFENNEDDLDIDDIFSEDSEGEEDKDDLDYVNDFINEENKEEEDFEDIEEDSEIDNQAMKVTQDLDIADEEEVGVEKTEVKDILQEKKKSGFPLKKILLGMIGAGIIGAAGFIGYMNQDKIISVVTGNSLEREADSIYSVEFEKKTQEIAEKILAGKIAELNSTIDVYETKLAEIELNQVTLMNKNRELETNKAEQQAILNTIQKNDNQDSKSMLELEKRLEQFMVEIDSVKDEQGDNKELLKKTVEATLNLIKENKMLDKDLEGRVYGKVYTEFKKIFDSQRFRLNDLSIIEGKLNEALSFNKQILQDLKQSKIDNQKLVEEQRDLNRKVIKLERALEEKETTPFVQEQKDNNVINLLKKNTPDNAIIIDKKADNTSTIPEYHLQGIIGGNVAYLKVKGQEGARARAYSVGDTLEGYGKILRIETSYIVTEKGELRRERKR